MTDYSTTTRDRDRDRTRNRDDDRRYSDRYEANSRPGDAYTNHSYRAYRRGYDRYGRPLPNYYYYPPNYYPPAYYSYPWRR